MGSYCSAKSPTEGLSVKLLEDEEVESFWTGKVWNEVVAMYRVAWPIIVTNALATVIILVSVMFVGHLGELELSSASVSNSVANVTGFILLLGLSTALETLCGQAFGAKKYRVMGVYLQAAILVSLLSCVPVLVVWFNIETLLIWLGQDPLVSRRAGGYMLCLIPGLLLASVLHPVFKFLQTQSLVYPMMLCTLLAAIVHPFACYFLIYPLGLGYYGGGFAIMFSFWCLLIALIGYTAWSGKCKHTFTGFVLKEAFGATPMYVRLAIPSAGMLCLEYWTFEIFVLCSGVLANPQLQLSLLTICLNTSQLVYTFATGLGAAASTRVSNALGARSSDSAKFSSTVALGLAIFHSCIIFTVMILVRNVWGLAFSNEKEIVNYVAEVLPILALASLMDGVQGVLSGVTRGCGRQDVGLYINLGAFYFVGIPVGLTLAFVFNFSGKGLVMGLASGVFTQMTCLLLLVLTTDWKKMVNDSQRRLEGPYERLLPTDSSSFEVES